MVTEYTDAELAEGKIKMVRLRLAENYSFHVLVLEQLRPVACPAVGTMGVMVDGDHIALLYNPSFVIDTPMPELGGVLLHEVHHVVLGHLTADRADFPDTWARIVAEEVTVNEYVKEPLPKGVIVLADYPNLPPLESTRERYERLRNVKRRLPIESPHVSGDGKCGTGTGTSQAAGQAPAGAPTKTKGKSSQIGKNKAPKPGTTTLDDHTVWESCDDREQAEQTIRDAIEQATLTGEVEQLPPELQAAIIAAGLLPGDDVQQLASVGRGKLNWRQLLRRFVGQAVEIRPVFNRAPRRFPEMIGLVPGRGRQATKAKVMAIVDTSASLTPELLEEVNAELTGLARNFDVLIVECDAVIHRVYPYRRPLKEVCGRGGTDLRPPLERNFLAEHKPDLIIYFTDGEGPAPLHAPRVPLIWGLVPEGAPPAPWGRVVKMENP